MAELTEASSHGDKQQERGAALMNEASAEEDNSSSARSSGGQKDLERPSAEEIYKQVARNAQEELKRSSLSLAISGIAGGLFMGLSGLGVGLAMVTMGGSTHLYFLSRMFYPLGFIVVMIGRAQLFTENTLYPVALVLAERKGLLNTLRLWVIVLTTNVIGAFAFAALISWVPSVPHPIVEAVASLGKEAVAVPWPAVFWTGVTAGWIIATAAWLVSGSSSVLGSVTLIWLLTFVVGLGSFALHRHVWRNLSGRADAQSRLAQLPLVAAVGCSGKYLRWRVHGHSAGIWTGGCG